jgi:hypothetical protein
MDTTHPSERIDRFLAASYAAVEFNGFPAIRTRCI